MAGLRSTMGYRGSIPSPALEVINPSFGLISKRHSYKHHKNVNEGRIVSDRDATAGWGSVVSRNSMLKHAARATDTEPSMKLFQLYQPPLFTR